MATTLIATATDSDADPFGQWPSCCGSLAMFFLKRKRLNLGVFLFYHSSHQFWISAVLWVL